MAQPLMPKATAVWLVENTSLTFEQVAEFCGMHELEVQAIADGEVAVGMVGRDPVAGGELTAEEIARVEANPNLKLRMRVQDLPQPVARSKGPRYTPVTKRGDKPDAIAHLLKAHPELSDAQICKLIGTTKPTIAAVRDKTHWNAANIKARNPVLLGLCSQRELDAALERARRGRPEPETPDMDAVDEDMDPAVAEDEE
ncbi:DUF1013 domain-containing protein [Niveispirillum cyanobacteriorum]|uniref:DUF1013 domain-containing protein n=1 Tax=Niveispirillum cyanobacteriorum TaxID=1612173 RepID=A0A2K9NA64_9PROT|nr:DUF1013 domain-containing protein [Niveispirillum cyanobacteriorum]AUN30040.1 DUF1013 domain-containing protein [Niveispirillum cyanobacteriorum]MBJ7417814.1 DUF1013 domain-containing protein [Niveispirillum sp.]GGE88439.1 hypothetical protein GCM10011317_51780 [Niveispirillum cyanobacteriorum]